MRLPSVFLKTSAFLALTSLFFACRPGFAAPIHSHARAKHKTVTVKEAREAAARKEQLRNRLDHLHHHMHTVRATIHHARAQENTINESIGVVEGRIRATRERLHAVNTRLAALTNKHVLIVKRMEETRSRLFSRRAMLARRLSDNYERGQASYAQVLIRSRSVHELLSRGYYVRQIVQSDAELIQGVRADLKQIEVDKKLLEKQTNQEKALSVEIEMEKQRLAEDVARKQQILQGVRQVREEAQDELDDLEDEANAMTDRIRMLSAILRLRREAQAREQSAAGGKKAHLPDAIPPAFHGRFARPVSGPITSGFGYRFHPILHRRKMHTGIDFGAGYGAPIHAAGDGVVIMAASTRGYGNCVIIDHGDGLSTLYGHCSELLVSEGDNVKRGQVIARVGATGMATGPHLHFEVRRNGIPVSPY